MPSVASAEKAVPSKLPNLNFVDTFVDQINEPGGKQSCFLSSQLNALIVRQALNSDYAIEIQNTLATHPKYAECWRPAKEMTYISWQAPPQHLANILLQDFGVEATLGFIESPDIPGIIDILQNKLQEGHAALLLGESVIGRHVRLAFAPTDQEDTIFVHDPKYSETTGLYTYDDLPTFQKTNVAVIA